MKVHLANKGNNRLGRGLDSLLGPTHSENKVLFLNVEKVFPNKNQPRKQFQKEDLEDLAQSIKNHGVLQPILVQEKTKGFEIIAGERRWRASLLAGLHKIPVIVKSPSAEQTALWSLLENLQRKDLNPIEEARAYREILEKQKINQEQLAQHLGQSRSSLANSLRLLQLDSEVQKYLESRKISFSQAKEILKVKSPAEQRALAKKCIQGSLTVRSLARQVQKKSKTDKHKSSQPSWMNQSLQHLEKKFSKKIQLELQKKGRGKLSFVFSSQEELKDLLDRLYG